MASKVVTCNLQLDEDATRIAETVAAMLNAQGDASNIDAIVLNAVRIAYGERVKELVKAAKPAKPKSGVGSSTYSYV